MTRINTNVSSLNAQKTLSRSNAQLQQALTRLSTGLRINSGKDDPAGLIASETLKADITATNKAIANSQRANQMITTADSALGQISSLLNDIRGLVSEAANTGAMSAEQIAANQLQIDSSLEAIDRIARVTSFQGKRLLDGNLDFTTSGVSNSQITDLQIDQATFGTQSQIGVAVDVVAEAEKGALTYNSNTIAEDIVLEVGGSEGYEAFTFAAGSSVSDLAAAINLVSDALGVEATTGSVTATEDRAGQVNLAATGGSLKIKAKTAGAAAGDVAIQFVENTTDQLAVSVVDGNLRVALGVNAATSATGIETDLNSVAGEATITIDANIAGSAYANVSLNIVETGVVGDPTTVTYDYETKTITVSVETVTGLSATDVATEINSQLGTLFTATAGGTTPGNDVTAGNKGVVTGSATDKSLSSDNTLAELQAAILADVGAGHANDLFDVSEYTGVLTGSLNQYAYSSTYGQTNVGLGSDPNNGILFMGVEGTQSTPFNFVKSANNQPLTITYTENTATNGYSTAYLQGVGATLKVVANEQGTHYDGLTIQFNDVSGTAPTDRSVIYDPTAKTLTINYNSLTEGTEFTAAEVAAKIESTGLFTTTVIGSATGTISTSQTAISAGGNKFTSININLATDVTGAIISTAADIINAVNSSADLQAMGITAANLGSSTGTGKVTAGSAYFTPAGVTKVPGNASGTTYAAGGDDSRLTVTAKTPGAAYNGVKIRVYDDPTVTAGVNERIVYNANTKELALYVDSGHSTVNDVLARFNSANNPTEYAMFSLGAFGSGDGVLTAGDEGLLAGGMVDSGVAEGAVKMVENFDEGDQVGETLQFVSTKYGSDQFVHVTALKGTFTTYNAAGEAVDRDAGKDVNVRINGISAVAKGLNVAFNTSSLDMRFTLNENVTQGTRIAFDITGGGAQFQLGPDVLSNQQARIGISSISTVKLGGDAGRLYELRSGGPKALDADTGGAAAVVEEVITQITNIRGRLGAFQKTTLDTNIAALTDTVEVLTQAQSDIGDADFAAETANMTRANILVQSGLSVLSTANQNPQNILKLLQQ